MSNVRCSPHAVRGVGRRVLFALCIAGLASLGVPGEARAEDEASASLLQSSEKVKVKRAIHPDDQAISELHEQLNAIWTGANLRRGTTAIVVTDAVTGEELYEVHGDDPLNPASNTKLVSTGTVLATLGPDWTYKTQLFGAAPDASGVIDGGLYLHGNYDPTLGSGAVEWLAGELATAGVKEVRGDLVLSGDDGRDALASNFVRVTVRGEHAGRAPSFEVSPPSDLVEVVSAKVRVKSRGRSHVRLASSWKSLDDGREKLEISLRGTLRAGQERVVRARLRNVQNFTGSVLKQALQDQGIAVQGEVRTASFDAFNSDASRAGRLPFALATHESAPISSLVARVNKRSLNHLSDRLVMSAARSVYGGPLDMQKAVVLMKDWLGRIGVDPEQVVIDTGSGLSYRTKLSARQIVRVLRAAGGYAEHAVTVDSVKTFRRSLAIGGIDGTLRGRFKTKGSTLTGRVRGKTGTLRSVIALSGFITRGDGRTVCFSIVTNGHRNHKRRRVRLEHEHLVTKLDGFLARTATTAQQVGAALAPQSASLPLVTMPASHTGAERHILLRDAAAALPLGTAHNFGVGSEAARELLHEAPAF